MMKHVIREEVWNEEIRNAGGVDTGVDVDVHNNSPKICD